MKSGGRKVAPVTPAAAPVDDEDRFPGIDGSDGGPTLADRVLGMFDDDSEET